MREFVANAFEQYFGLQASHLVSAPGRVILMGEYACSASGYVVAACINRHTWAAGRVRPDGMLNVYSLNHQQIVTLHDQTPPTPTTTSWVQAVRGIWHVLGKNGTSPQGADVLIYTDVPDLAGLGALSSQQVVLLDVCLALHQQTLAQQANLHISQTLQDLLKPIHSLACDHLVMRACLQNQALLVNRQSLESSLFRLPPGLTLAVLDTGTRRQMIETAHSQRQQHYREAVAMLGLSHWQALTPATVDKYHDQLGDLRYQRLRHMVGENQRAQQLAEALQHEDYAQIGPLFAASLQSQRENYDVSSPELDTMCEIAQQQNGCWGVRIIGPGFGGGALALIENRVAEQFRATVTDTYQKATRIKPVVHLLTTANGSQLVRAAVE